MFSIIRKLKLKSQVLFLIGIAIFTMVLVQLLVYLNSYNITQERTSVYAINIMKQVEDKLKTVFLDIQGAAQRISYNASIQEFLVVEENIDRLERVPAVNSVMELVRGSNIHIEDIWLIDLKERQIHSSSSTINYLSLKELVKKDEILQENLKKPVFSSIVYDKDLRKYYYSYTVPIFSSMQEETPFESIGYCIIICRMEQIQDIVEDISLTDNSVFLVLDAEGNLAAVNDQNLLSDRTDENDLFHLNYTGEFLDRFNERSHLKQESVVDITDWKVVSIISRGELTKDFLLGIRVGIIINMVMAFILIAVGLVIVGGITVPVAKIVRFTETIEKSGSKMRLEISGNYEISKLIENINQMLDEIDNANRKVLQSQSVLYETQLAKKQAELSALQSQINPHFLYNTLDCIRSIALSGGIPEIVSISTAMSRIFRYSIKERDIVAVKDELKCIEDYISIMKVRYMERFQYNIDIDDQIMQMKIPKMILQPIVENAIYHGLEQKRGKGGLSVRGKLIGDRIVSFEVSDDGIGMGEEELKKLIDEINTAAHSGDFITNSNDKRSIGLLNIYNRIRLTFGEKCGLKIYSNKNEGTRVIIYIPTDL